MIQLDSSDRFTFHIRRMVLLVCCLIIVGCEKSATERGTPKKSLPVNAKELYAKHCSACHGEDGDGEGPGSRSLWPPARNFRRESFRLVSTKDRIPVIADVDAVIQNGMPGTSMKAFGEFSRNERIALSKYVLAFRRDGLQDAIVSQAGQEEIDEAAIQRIVDRRMSPSAQLQLTGFESPTADSLRRGRDHYLRHGCQSCHGDNGVGRADSELYDETHRPTRARDLQHEPFKGGHNPESIALRIRLGMPGTPHPANPLLSDGELIDLVHYCRSLSREPKFSLTGHQRRTCAIGRDYIRLIDRLAN